MKKILLFLLLLAVPGFAQSNQKSALLTYNYDLTSTSFIYCRYLGLNGDPWGVAGGNPSQSVVETVGSSTTITASTAATGPFTGLAAGDLLVFRIGGTGYQRRIVTYTSVDEVVVDTAIDLGTTGVPFQWYQASCGTAATDGWFDVSLFYNLTYVRNIITFNATSIDTQLECRVSAAPTSAMIIETKNATATGVYSYTLATGAWDACRVGLKLNTDGGAQSIVLALSYNQ